MSLVRVHNVALSLDGLGTGGGQTEHPPLEASGVTHVALTCVEKART